MLYAPMPPCMKGIVFCHPAKHPKLSMVFCHLLGPCRRTSSLGSDRQIPAKALLHLHQLGSGRHISSKALLNLHPLGRWTPSQLTLVWPPDFFKSLVGIGIFTCGYMAQARPKQCTNSGAQEHRIFHRHCRPCFAD